MLCACLFFIVTLYLIYSSFFVGFPHIYAVYIPNTSPDICPSPFETNLKCCSGDSLDLELLKQFRFPAVISDMITGIRLGAPDGYHKQHPSQVLQCLPRMATKLAEWIDFTIQDEVGYPDK